MALFETRETQERKATLNQHIPSHCKYFSSFIDQYKGGIGLFVKREFLERFDKFNFDTSWQVLRVGRIGRLVLEGIYGLLHIYVVYLDPSDSRHQCSDIDLLGSSLDSRAHSLVVGDLNFVQEASDRYLKATGTYSLGDDAAVAKQWTSSIASRGLVELKQPYHTCEKGMCFSRIDRIYSSLHAASIFLLDTSCVALDQEPELSDHRPVSCFFRRRVRSQSTSVPSWVVDHPAFGEEVFAEYHYRIRSAPGDGFSRLAVFKDSVRCACKYIKHVKHSQPAQTVQDKLRDERIRLRHVVKSWVSRRRGHPTQGNEFL